MIRYLETFTFSNLKDTFRYDIYFTKLMITNKKNTKTYDFITQIRRDLQVNIVYYIESQIDWKLISQSNLSKNVSQMSVFLVFQASLRLRGITCIAGVTLSGLKHLTNANLIRPFVFEKGSGNGSLKGSVAFSMCLHESEFVLMCSTMCFKLQKMK